MRQVIKRFLNHLDTEKDASLTRDIAFKPRGKSKSHSESYEPQESCDNGSVSAFSKPRVGKGGERFEIVGRLECLRRQRFV